MKKTTFLLEVEYDEQRTDLESLARVLGVALHISHRLKQEPGLKVLSCKPSPLHPVLLVNHDDQAPEDQSPQEIELAVEKDGYGLVLKPAGYGLMTMQPGYGGIVYLETWSGELRLIVWADINAEEPTHVISLEGAREELRKDV